MVELAVPDDARLADGRRMRLPGRCSGCGARVELAMDRDGGGPFLYRPLPWAWCEPRTDTAHVCSTSNGRSDTVEGPGAVVAAPAMPPTSVEGREMTDVTGAR